MRKAKGWIAAGAAAAAVVALPAGAVGQSSQGYGVQIVVGTPGVSGPFVQARGGVVKVTSRAQSRRAVYSIALYRSPRAGARGLLVVGTDGHRLSYTQWQSERLITAACRPTRTASVWFVRVKANVYSDTGRFLGQLVGQAQRSLRCAA